MKKSIKTLLTILSAALLFNITSCGSTDADNEDIISTVEANHIRVDVKKSTVNITVTKPEGEVIDKIDVKEIPNGSLSSVDMSATSSCSFVWPFAEADKEYTLCATIYTNNGTLEETVSFKTGDKITPAITYNDAYDLSVISLIAKGNQRLIKIDTPYDTIASVLNKVKPQDTKLLISLYSGKHYKASEKDAVLLGTMTYDFSKSALAPYEKGMDIIRNASNIGYTAFELNQKLSAKMTYFAVASLQFKLPDYPQEVTFIARGIYANDTIYTPIAADELPDSSAIVNGDAK